MWPAAEPLSVSPQPHLGELRVWTSPGVAIELRTEVVSLTRQVAALDARLAQLETILARPAWWQRAWAALVRLARQLRASWP
jgi:predicted nicotinamide N-methyase